MEQTQSPWWIDNGVSSIQPVSKALARPPVSRRANLLVWLAGGLLGAGIVGVLASHYARAKPDDTPLVARWSPRHDRASSSPASAAANGQRAQPADARERDVPPAPKEAEAKKEVPPPPMGPTKVGVKAPKILWPTLPTDAKTERLLKALDSPSKAERLAATRELGNKGTQGRVAIPVLLERMRRIEKEYADQANQAALALAQIGAPAVESLTKALEDPAAIVRARALWALGIIGPDAGDAFPAICPFLTDDDAAIRLLAVMAVAEMPQQARAVRPQLAKLLRDTEPQVRLHAARALRQAGPETLGLLLPVTRDSDPAIRWTAVQSLRLFHASEEAIQSLVDAARDPEPAIRSAATAHLIELGPRAKAAIPRLLERLKENNLELQSAAYTTILAIGSPGDSDLLRALDELNPRHGWSWPDLKPAERKEAVRRLVLALEDPVATRRLGAVLALGQIGPEAKDALPSLLKRLNDSNRSVLAATVLVLPLIDPAQKTEGKTSEMLIAETLSALSSTKKVEKLDNDELVQLYVLTWTLTCKRFLGAPLEAKLADTVAAAQGWSAKAVDSLPYSPAVIAALVRGINASAEFNLGFTEPFTRLDFKLRILAKDATDIAPLGFALVHLGEAVSNDSAVLMPVRQAHWEILTNSAMLDWLITNKKQLIVAITLPEWQKRVRQLELALQQQAVAIQRLQITTTQQAQTMNALLETNKPQAHLINQIWNQAVTRDSQFNDPIGYPASDRSNPWYFASDSTTVKHGSPTAFNTPPRMVQGDWTMNPGMVSGTVVVVAPQQYWTGRGPAYSGGGSTTNGPGSGDGTGRGGAVSETHSTSSRTTDTPTRINHPFTISKDTVSKSDNPTPGTMVRMGGSPTQNSKPAPTETKETVLLRTQLELQFLLALKTQKARIPSDDLMLRLEKTTDSELLDWLQDPRPWVRCRVATQIGQKRLPAAKELIPLLADPSVEVRDAAHAALIRLAHGTDLGPYLSESRVQPAIERWNEWLTAQEAPPSRHEMSTSKPEIKSVPVEK
jgi:HEAT repeat protein